MRRFGVGRADQLVAAVKPSLLILPLPLEVHLLSNPSSFSPLYAFARQESSDSFCQTNLAPPVDCAQDMLCAIGGDTLRNSFPAKTLSSQRPHSTLDFFLSHYFDFAELGAFAGE